MLLPVIFHAVGEDVIALAEVIQQRIGNGTERGVDAQDNIPHGAAPEVLRGGGDQRPDFRHALVPCGKCGI